MASCGPTASLQQVERPHLKKLLLVGRGQKRLGRVLGEDHDLVVHLDGEGLGDFCQHSFGFVADFAIDIFDQDGAVSWKSSRK